MNSTLDVNEALFLPSFSFSKPKSKSLVIDKSFCCKTLESMRLIFSKNAFLAQWELDAEEENCMLVSISDHC